MFVFGPETSTFFRGVFAGMDGICRIFGVWDGGGPVDFLVERS
jgi:hypothetical protein